MHAFRLAIASAFVLVLVACGADEPSVMPDVTGTKLDVALSDIKAAGFDDEPEVLGGGMFGVVVKSNWTVCEQDPAPKDEISGKPRLTVDRSCDETEEKSDEPAEEPTETATAEPEPEPAPVVDITVDKLLDKLNSANLGGIELGDQFRLTGELVGADLWGTGASGDFFVYLKTKVGSDLIVFVEKSDADDWQNGTKVEMVVENVEVTISGETTDGWLKARSVETLTAGTTQRPKKLKQAAPSKNLLQDLAAYAELNNTSLGRTVIDSIDSAPRGFDVRLNPSMAGVTVQQAQMLISQWNENIVDMLADAGRGAGDGSVKYYLGGQLVAQNKEILDPWSVEFEGMLDQ